MSSFIEWLHKRFGSAPTVAPQSYAVQRGTPDQQECAPDCPYCEAARQRRNAPLVPGPVPTAGLYDGQLHEGK